MSAHRIVLKLRERLPKRPLESYRDWRIKIEELYRGKGDIDLHASQERMMELWKKGLSPESALVRLAKERVKTPRIMALLFGETMPKSEAEKILRGGE